MDGSTEKGHLLQVLGKLGELRMNCLQLSTASLLTFQTFHVIWDPKSRATWSYSKIEAISRLSQM